MKYEDFMQFAGNLARNYRTRVTKCGFDEKGYYAHLRCGITFLGNFSSSKVTVRWGDHHQAMVNIGGISEQKMAAVM